MLSRSSQIAVTSENVNANTKNMNQLMNKLASELGKSAVFFLTGIYHPIPPAAEYHAAAVANKLEGETAKRLKKTRMKRLRGTCEKQVGKQARGLCSVTGNATEWPKVNCPLQLASKYAVETLTLASGDH